MIKPWIASVSGAILILGSTAISGIMVSQQEHRISIERAELTNLTTTLEKADRAYELSGILGDLSYIQRSIVRYSIFQNQEVQSTWDSIHAYELYPIIINLYGASGRTSELVNDIPFLEGLREKASNRDSEAYAELQQLAADMTLQSAEYRAQLVLDIANREISVAEQDSVVQVTQYVAVFFQLLGLIVLLTREFSQSLAPTNSRSDET